MSAERNYEGGEPLTSAGEELLDPLHDLSWMLATSRFPRAVCGCGEPVWYHWLDDPKIPATKKRMRMIANCAGVHGVAEIEAEYEKLVAEAVVERMKAAAPQIGKPVTGRFFTSPIVKSRYVPGQASGASWDGAQYAAYQKVIQMSGRAVRAGQAIFRDEVASTLIEDPGKLDGPDGREALASVHGTAFPWARQAVSEAFGMQPDLSWGANRHQLAEYLAPKIRKPRWRRQRALISWHSTDLQPMLISAESGYNLLYSGGGTLPASRFERELTAHLMDLRAIHPVLLEELRWRAELLRESNLSDSAIAEALRISEPQLKRLLRKPHPSPPLPLPAH